MAMATIWNRKYGFQLRVSHKLLPKGCFAIFPLPARQ
jgi:hypothetical protein